MVRWEQSNASFNISLRPKLLSKFLKKIEDLEIGGLCYLYSNDRNFRLEHFSIFCQMINVYFILLWNISKWLYANLIVLFVWTKYELRRKKVFTQSWFKNKPFSIRFFVTSDALKIVPNSVMFYYYIWYDFYCIRR